MATPPAAERAAELRRRARAPRPPLLHAGRPRDLRRRVRRADATSCTRSRPRTPSCARRTRPPSAWAAARWTLRAGDATCGRCSRWPTCSTRRSCAPGTCGCVNPLARQERRRRLRVRAEDRRPRHLPGLRGRPLRARRDARRRRGGRGRDPNLRTIEAIPLQLGGAPATARGARARSTCRVSAFKAPQRAARGGRRADLRQPAQRGRGLAAPAGPAHHRLAAPVGVVLRGGRGRRRRAADPVGVARVAGRARVPGEPGDSRHAELAGWWRSAAPGRSAARGSTSRWTAPWSSSTTRGLGAPRGGGPRAARRDRLEVPRP